ncbi:response regulator [Patescibacteria group bacterium]|nr:response regulator [Patescibacteria group bacterium]
MPNLDVLLIEDEDSLIKPLQFAFEKRGITLRVAKTGDEGVFAVRKHVPDLVLLDLVLPKMNGFEVLKEIRRDPSTAHIPVLILSNLAREGQMKRGMESGANGYIVKSNASIEAIVGTVLSMMGE